MQKSKTQEQKTGQQLALFGMQSAEEHANDKIENWGDRAFEFLKDFAIKNQEFMTEDVRVASEGIVPDPPDLRAWGSIVRKAKGAGIIKHDRYESVKNPKAHASPCSVWRSLIY